MILTRISFRGYPLAVVTKTKAEGKAAILADKQIARIDWTEDPFYENASGWFDETAWQNDMTVGEVIWP